MREASRSLAGGSRQAIARKALVVAEVALSLVLLAGSSVLLRRFVAIAARRSRRTARTGADAAGPARAAALS